MKHHILKFVGMFSWIVTSLVAINVGLRPFGYNIFETDMAMKLGGNGLLVVHYVILACGVYSLVLLAMASTGNCSCGCCNGKNCRS